MAVTWVDGVGAVDGHFVVNFGKRPGLNAAGLAVYAVVSEAARYVS